MKERVAFSNSEAEKVRGYAVEEKIWQGATSTVFRCSSLNGRARWGQVVALKVLHPYRNTPLYLKQFRNEARLQGRLSHESIVRVHGVASKGGSPAIFMEYVPGTSLKPAVQAGGVSTEWLIGFFSRLAGVAGYLHRRGIVHNDIKPENIIVSKDCTYFKIIDFGYAQKTGRWTRKARYAGGTEKYMAPERALGISSPGSDIYSVGVMLDEFLRERVGNGKLYAIVARATHKESFRRYPSMDALKVDIDRLYIEYTS